MDGKDFRRLAGRSCLSSRFPKKEIQMLKSILAVVVGFIAMAIFSFAAFSCAYLALGVDRVFEPESYDVSTLWMVVMVVLSLIGGVLGGFICAAISKSMGVCKVFAGIVLALGLLSAIVTTMKERPDTARSGDVPNFQAMRTWRRHLSGCVCLIRSWARSASFSALGKSFRRHKPLLRGFENGI